MDISILFADLERLERDLGLPDGFLAGLIEEDDWSFIIKAHAVVEAAITHLLGSATDHRLADIFRRLPFSGTTSKLGAAAALELLDEPSRDFPRRLAELRNRLVHQVSYLTFDVATYVKDLPSSESRDLAASIAKAVAGSEWEGFVELAREGLATMAKPTLAFGVIGVLARTLFSLDPKEYERAAAKAKAATGGLALLALLLILIGAASRGSRAK